MSSEKSYVQVLKSSSIMGAAAGIALLLGMVRVKFAAVLIGAAGVGLIASLTALQGVFSSLAGLGLQSSGVREIASAAAKGDDLAMGRAVLTLRRLCWVTGLVGMIAMALLSPLLSQLTFGHDGYTLDIAALGVVILFGNLSGGQMALVQGVRRIGDMAKVNIYGAAAGTVAAVCLYNLLGLRGIVPTLVFVSTMQLVLSSYYARLIQVPNVSLDMNQTFAEASIILRLGFPIMLNGLMGSVVTYLVITLITHYEGNQAVGLFSAAFALSGMFVNFVLGAMGADYYPRLIGVANDKNVMVQMVNEQTEIGLLLALPGLICTIAMAPWILQLFYAHEFLGAVELLQWFILGCLGRVISWPLGYVMLALGKMRYFLLAETSFNFVHIALVALLLQFYGIEGVAIAFVILYVCYTVAVLLIARFLISFIWSYECKNLIIISIGLCGACFVVSHILPIWYAIWFGLFITISVSIICLRGLIVRVGNEHMIIRLIRRIPGGELLIPSR